MVHWEEVFQRVIPNVSSYFLSSWRPGTQTILSSQFFGQMWQGKKASSQCSILSAQFVRTWDSVPLWGSPTACGLSYSTFDQGTPRTSLANRLSSLWLRDFMIYDLVTNKTGQTSIFQGISSAKTCACSQTYWSICMYLFKIYLNSADVILQS